MSRPNSRNGSCGERAVSSAMQLRLDAPGGGQGDALVSSPGVAAAACTVSARPIRVAAFSSARSACSAWICAVCMVTWAVTNGLPSRSAPIQLP